MADLGRSGDSVISVKFYQGRDRNNDDGEGGGARVLLATASMDGVVRVYRSHPEKGIEIKFAFEGPGEGIECHWIDWHSRGPILIGGYADGSVWMWNVGIPDDGGDGSVLMAIFSGHITSPATCGTFTPDGKMIIGGSGEGVVLLVNSPKDPSKPISKIVPRSHQETSLREITHVAVHPGSQIFMAGDSEGHLRVYKCSPGNQTMPLHDLSPLHSASIESIAFHPLGSLAVSASMDGKVVIYDSSSFSPRHIIKSSSLFHHDQGQDVEGFTLAKWLPALANGPTLNTSSLSFALLLGTALGRVAIVEARSGLLLRRFSGRFGRPVLDASVSSGGILAVAFDDGIISLYQL